MNEYIETPRSYKPEVQPMMPGGVSLKVFEDAQNRNIQLAKSAHNWRKAFFLSMLLSIVCVSGYLSLASKSTIFPYFLRIDNYGHVTPLGYIHQEVYQPTEQQIRHHLFNFIRDLKSVPKDEVILGQNWERAYSFLDNPTRNKVDQLMIQFQEKVDLRKDTVSITLNSITKVAGSQNTYQMRWTERVYHNDGNVKSIENILGLFTIAIYPPANENSILNNPLGITITDIAWSKEAN